MPYHPNLKEHTMIESLSDYFDEPRHKPVIHCEVCGAHTQDGKPYCINHIFELAYASGLSEQQEEIDKDLANVARRGISAIRLNSPVIKDILLELQDHETGIYMRNLSLNLDIPIELLTIYIEYLNNKGLLILKETRKAIIVYPQTRTASSEEVAKHFKVHRSMVHYWAQQGAPVSLAGKSYKFNLQELDEWLTTYTAQKEADRRRIREEVYLKKAVPISHRTLTKKQLAESLGVSESTVEYWIKHGLPHDEAADLGKSAKLRMFDRDEVAAWVAEFKAPAMKKRIAGSAYSQKLWDEISEYLRQGHTVLEAAEYFRISPAAIYKNADVPPLNEDKLTRFELAEKLGLDPQTVWHWVKHGTVPHIRGPRGKSSREMLLFDEQAVRDWLSATGFKGRRKNPACRECGVFIEGDRPYCFDHSSYVRGVEEAIVADATTPTDIDGMTARDIYNTLKFEGPHTIPGLARELGRSKEVIRKLVLEMEKWNMVHIPSDKRKLMHKEIRAI